MSKSKLLTFLLIFLSFSAIFGFINFDSASAQGVTWTYNADTNTATASGSGNTNFAELVQADIAGGWGGIYTADATGTQIIVAGKIVVGDGSTSTVFSDTSKQILCLNGAITGSNQQYILVKNRSILTLGTLVDSSSKSTANGCQLLTAHTGYNYFFIDTQSQGVVNLYSSTLSSLSSSDICYLRLYKSTDELYNCIFGQGIDVDVMGGITLFNIQVWRSNNSGRSFEFYNSDATVSKLYSTYGSVVVYSQSVYNFTITELYARAYTTLIQLGSSWSGTGYLINADVDKWTFVWNSLATGKVYRQYTFNLNVLNGEITDFVQNANVTLYKDNVKIYSALTNSSGMIPTQTLTYGYYQQSTGNTIQNATSPYYLVISHPDWQTYVSRFYITESLRLTVSMQEPTYTGYTEVEKSDYTTIILFVISLILCIIGLALTVPLLPLISLTISVLNIIFLSEPSIFNILLIVLNVTFTLIALVRAKTKNN